MSQHNIIFEADSYKLGMHLMYPDHTTEMYSFIESRGGMFKEMVVAGVPQFVNDYLTTPFTEEDVQELEDFFKLRDESFDTTKLRHIVKKHGGYLPLEIKALPEGTVIPVGTPFAIVYNTDPDAYWLTTLIETVFLSYVWSMVSVATLVREMKKKIKSWNDKTCSDFEGIDYQLHNFGDRGAKPGFAKLAGTMHLLSFNGTDCIASSRHIYKTYNEKDKVFGSSIPASEHSISTTWGRYKEKDYVLRMIGQFKDKHPAMSIVADTYNIFKFTEMVCTDTDIQAAIKDLADMGKKVVLRPDSGEPDVVLEAMLSTIELHMGSSVNNDGYKLLPPGIGIIWGDSITLEKIDIIYDTLERLGWASCNIVIGSGGYITDFMGRDHLKFAMKGSNAIVAGETIEIMKEPITAAWKKSKKGKFSVVMKDNVLTWKIAEKDDICLLETVYINSNFSGFGKFQDCKDRAAL